MNWRTAVIVLVVALSACNSTPEDFIADGVLDCADDSEWTEQGSVPEGTVGLGSEQAAVEAYLTPFMEEHGGEIVTVDLITGALVVDSREVVLGSANEMPAGGWLVLTGSGCDGFDR